MITVYGSIDKGNACSALFLALCKHLLDTLHNFERCNVGIMWLLSTMLFLECGVYISSDLMGR